MCMTNKQYTMLVRYCQNQHILPYDLEDYLIKGYSDKFMKNTNQWSIMGDIYDDPFFHTYSEETLKIVYSLIRDIIYNIK